MNPFLLRSVAVVASATVGVVVSPILVTAGLGAIGFSATGPVAGSMAAVAQSGIGNVVAGTLFAGVQSVAMGGAMASAVATAASAVGAAVGVGAAAGAVVVGLL